MKSKIGKVALLSVGFFMPIAMGSGMAANVIKPFANRAFYCEGGSESSGQNYYFKASVEKIERLDHRFPSKGVVFALGGARKGRLTENWTFETLSKVSRNRMHLYERVSMRSQAQNKHVYRTYEMYAQNGRLFMILYDGVNGARDWRMKTTRKCGVMQGNRVIQGPKQKYWAPSVSF